MSQRANAPYRDKVHDDGITIEYEGQDVPRRSYDHNPKVKISLAAADDGAAHTQSAWCVRASPIDLCVIDRQGMELYTVRLTAGMVHLAANKEFGVLQSKQVVCRIRFHEFRGLPVLRVAS
jgi:hypothetical protein